MAAGAFSRALVSHWRDLQDKLRSQDEEITVDGQSLSLAAVVACARYASRDRLCMHLHMGALAYAAAGTGRMWVLMSR
jgi:hypothetical protein